MSSFTRIPFASALSSQQSLLDATADMIANGALDPAFMKLGAMIYGIASSILSPGIAAGTVIASLVDPFAGLGLGVTSYATFGTVPTQLALSNGQIVAGVGQATPGNNYGIGVLATSGDGKRVVGETINFLTGAASPLTTADNIILNRSGDTFSAPLSALKA